MERETVEALAPLLDRLGIVWVVIGAVAANRYRSEVRLTGDLDLLVASHGPGLDVLEATVRAAGWVLRRASPEGAILRLRHASYGAVDLILAETDYQREAIARAAAETGPGARSIRVLRVEDVLVHKLIAGRPRDVADIEDILARGPALDADYLEQWVDYWEVRPLWESLRHRG